MTMMIRAGNLAMALSFQSIIVTAPVSTASLSDTVSSKRSFVINSPQGVVRDRDEGISDLNAEDTDRLHDVLFVDEHRLQFVPHGERKSTTTIRPTSKDRFKAHPDDFVIV